MRSGIRYVVVAFAVVVVGSSAGAAEIPNDMPGNPLPSGAIARLGTVRLRHSAAALAFVSDGKTFATGGRDMLIRLWSVADGKEIRQFKGHANQVTGVAFSPDGKHLFSCSLDGTVRQWNSADGTEVRSGATNPSVPFTALVSHPTLPRLLTTDSDGTVREWDDKDQLTHMRSTAAHRGSTPVVLCPDGEHFATLTLKDAVVVLHDLDGKEVQRFPTSRRQLSNLAFSPDGKFLAAGRLGQPVMLWDVKTNREIRTLDVQYGFARKLAFSANGRYVAFNSDRSVNVIGVASGKQLRQFDISALAVHALVFSPDGKTLACCQGTAIHLWNLDSGEPRHEFAGHTDTVDNVRFSPDGKRLTSTSRYGSGYWWDATTGKPLAAWSTPRSTTFAAPIAPDGRSYYRATLDGMLRCDFNDGRPAEKPLPHSGQPFTSCVAVTSDGTMLALRGRDAKIHFVAADGKERGVLPIEGNRFQQFVFSPDGKQFAGSARTYNFPISIWEVPSGKETRQLDLRRPGVIRPLIITGVYFSPDNRNLLTLDTEQAQVAHLEESHPTMLTMKTGVALWEAAVGRERWRVTRPTGVLQCAAFSPDGKLIALGGFNGNIYFLDTATGAELGQFTGHRAAVLSLDFTPDCQRLASASEDGTVLVWDTTEMSKKSQPLALKRKPEQLADLWSDLAASDSAKAYQAVRTLAASPAESVPFLLEQLQHDDKVDQKRIERLIQELDDDEFDTREKAQKDLAALGTAAVPALRKALQGKPSVEAKRRIEALLEEHKDQAEVAPKGLREQRAVEALEHSGTAEALAALKKVAAGDATAPQTQDAKAALERLAQRAAKP